MSCYGKPDIIFYCGTLQEQICDCFQHNEHPTESYISSFIEPSFKTIWLHDCPYYFMHGRVALLGLLEDPLFNKVDTY